MQDRVKATGRSGITLFEVVLALVIFLLTLPALNALVQIGTQRAEEAKMTAQASLECRSKLAEVMVGAVPMETTDWTPLADENWYWRLEVGEAGVDGLKRIQVWAKFDLGERPFEVTISQFALDPSLRGSTLDRAILMTEPVMPETPPTTEGM